MKNKNKNFFFALKIPVSNGYQHCPDVGYLKSGRTKIDVKMFMKIKKRNKNNLTDIVWSRGKANCLKIK